MSAAIFVVMLSFFSPQFTTAWEAGSPQWTRYSNCSDINDVASTDEYIWAAASGGIVRWKRSDGEYTVFDATDGLVSKSWLDKARTIDIDSKGSIWSALRFGGLALYANGEWKMATTEFEKNDIRRSAMDSNDVMWFDTYNNFYRFNGAWTSFAGEFSDYSIKAVCVDDEDHVWVGDYGHIIHRYDGESWTRLTFEFGKGCGGISDLMVDHQGVLWVVSDGSCGMDTLHSYDGEKWTDHSIHEEGVSSALPVRDIAVDADNLIWLAASGGVYTYNGSDLERVSPDDLSAATCIRIDGNGRVCAGTSLGSVWCLDGGNWQRYETSQRLASNLVQTIAVDNDDVVWFGTRQGISSLDDGVMNTFNYGDTNSILFDSENTLWTLESGHLLSFDGTEWERFEESHLVEWDEDYLRALTRKIFVDSSDRLWDIAEKSISSYDGETWTIHSTGEPNILSRVGIVEDGEHTIWTLADNEISRFDGTTWTNLDDITDDLYGEILCMAVDHGNQLWFCTTNGVYRYYDGVVRAFNDIEGRPVLEIVVDLFNTVWFISYYRIFSYDGVEFTEHYGSWALSGNEGYHSPVVDLSNHLWVATGNHGVVRYDGESWTRYTLADGLADTEINDIAVDRNNVKWFATEYWGACSFYDGTPLCVEKTRTTPVISPVVTILPNPFNPATTINFKLPEAGNVTLTVYNMAGQAVRELCSCRLERGLHAYMWDGSGNDSHPVASGIYFVRLRYEDRYYTRKMMLVR